MNLERFKIRRSSYPSRKKSEGRLPVLKQGGKKAVSKSPSLPKRQLSPENSLTKPRSNTLQLPDDSSIQHISHSLEELDKETKDDDSGTRENGSGCSDIMDDVDSGATDGGASSDSARKRAAIDTLEEKIKRTMEQIKEEQSTKEDVGSNIVDGITGFSGGVVGNIKGAKETIVSKPREFAHLIKNKFGSADNITALKASEDSQHEEGDKSQGGGTLPARDLGGGKSDDTHAHSFKYNSDPEDNSSITSGSGFGAHSSPQSNSQTTSQQIVIPQVALDNLMQQLQETKDKSKALHETMQQVLEEFDNFKKLQIMNRDEVSLVKGQIDEDKFKLERVEEQMNDIAELNQHEVNNLKQDIESMEEKIEYRQEERTTDIQDLLENCQTRITKMELQQQQQQLISMEMVDNVTFRTILTKLINVVLALLAVILVFVSTAANFLAPFLTTRARILSTTVLVTSLFLAWNNWPSICDLFLQLYTYVEYLLVYR